MSNTQKERRLHARQPHALPIEIIVGERPILARLADISPGGLRFQVDPENLDFVTQNITAVRLDGSDRLAIRVIWGLYDGMIGAVFDNPAAARPVVVRLLAKHREYVAAR